MQKKKKKSLFFSLSITDHTLYQIKAKPQQKHHYDPPQNARASPWQLPLFQVTAHRISAEKLKKGLVSVLMWGRMGMMELLVWFWLACLTPEPRVWTDSWVSLFLDYATSALQRGLISSRWNPVNIAASSLHEGDWSKKNDHEERGHMHRS